MSVMVAREHWGYGMLKDGYQLVLWLNPAHAVNRDLSGQKHSQLVLLNNLTYHAPIYGYWEYVRRYMTGDTPFWYEISDRPRIPHFVKSNVEKDGWLKAIIDFVIGMVLILFFKPELFALWAGPLRHKWPEEVHQWSGKRCNWL